jgi:hypothetical protein
VPTPLNKLDLTIEAAIMAQVNEAKSDAVVRLRQFKADQLYCRYYIQFCEHDNLERLRTRYKAYK